MWRLLATLVLLLIVTEAHAEDVNGKFKVLGQGTRSCEDYLEARTIAYGDLPYLDWMNGFLTAINLEFDDTYDITGDANIDARSMWVEIYCREYPEKAFWRAVRRFSSSQYEYRLRIGPDGE